MNTTVLIEQWSMEGARRDPAGRFRSVDDTRALLLGANQPDPFARRPFLVDEESQNEDWQSAEVVREPAHMPGVLPSNSESMGATVDSTHQGVNWEMIVVLLACLAFWGAVAVGILAAV
jgi:hypothetical protein